jgi:hypothetical protein
MTILSFFLKSLFLLSLSLLYTDFQMLLQKYLSKWLLAKTAWNYLHILLCLFLLSFLLFIVCYNFLLDCFDCCSKIFRCSFPVIRCFVKNFSFTFAFFFLFGFLLFNNFRLLFRHNSFCLRIKLFSFAHKN